jgi:hypothetical protein
MTARSPNDATASLIAKDRPCLAWVEGDHAGRPNIVCATATPAIAPKN